MRRVDPRSISLELERVLPGGGPSLRIVEWGILAWTGIGVAAMAWAAGQVLGRVAPIVPFLVTAGLVVLVLNPAVSRLVGLGLPRRVAVTAVCLLALALVGLLLSLAVPLLVRQSENLIRSSPQLLRAGGPFARLARSRNSLLHQIGMAGTRWLGRHAANAKSILASATSTGLKLAHFAEVLFIGGLLGFFILLSLPEIGTGVAALIPPSRRDIVDPVAAEARRIFSGYLRARLIVSAVVGVLATIGLWAIHMPFWLVLGAIVGVANLVPMLGTWIGGIPVAIVALLTKPPAFILLVVPVIAVAHAIDGYVLSPILLKETTDLHPVVILLAVLIGADLLGFWGILAAIPVAGVTQFLVRAWALPRIASAGAPVPPEAPLGPARSVVRGGSG